MNSTQVRRIVSGLLFLFGTIWARADPAALPPAATNKVDFAKDIQPIIEQSCLKCHSGERPKGKFSLTSREKVLKGGQDQVDIIPGKSALSPLIQFVAQVVPDAEMPPTDKGKALTREQVGLLRAWIDQGANWPASLVLGETAAIRPELSVTSLPLPAAEKVDFARDIQPIFSEHCYACHGPKRQEGEVRWDNKEIAMQGGERGADIIPGKSVDSRLIHFVGGLDPDLIMPQKSLPLSKTQISLLRAWIDQGANWPDSASVKVANPRNHWAFKAPVRPPIPLVKHKYWPRNPIDNFVLAKLEKEKLAPSTEADRRTLIRRLSLDLLGLPPTIAEVERFVADDQSDAYDRLVERLLDSPHYGERQARHWLDAVKYADSNGYEKDLARSVYAYRDWVIDAYNRNLPFDQFAVAQLAGDLVPNPTMQDRIATGLLRNSMLNEEGGIDPEQFRVESIIERMDILGKAFLGLTINCCQCHNHKYDPISQKEYYRLFAFLNNDVEPQMEVPDKDQTAQRRLILDGISSTEKHLYGQFSDIPEKMAAWANDMKAVARDWVVLDPGKYYGSFGAKFEKLEDHSLLVGGSLPPVSVYSITAHTDLTNITGFRLEALTHPNLPKGGPGRAGNGNFVLTEFTVEAAPVHSEVKATNIPLQNATADFSQAGFPAAAAIDGKEDNATGWAVDDLPGRQNRDREIVFETKTPFGFQQGTTLKITLNQTYGSEFMLGRLRLSLTTGAQPLRADPLSHAARQILGIRRDQRTPEQQMTLFSFYRLTDARFVEANKQIDLEQSKWPAAPTTLVLQARAHRRQTHIFKRGDWQNLGAEVTPGVPSVLNPLPANAPLDRLGLARWLVNGKNPTVARVIVNRIWQEYFGRGLVATAEDFGMQGDPPTHPQLLDWLAVEFVESGWNVKHIQELIADSSTYRQSSVISPELWQRDQYNDWLARGPRVRVEAEIVHDIALSTSGLLNGKIGGPSVYPPIPDGVLSLGYGFPMPWNNADKSDDYRRALYTFEKRTVPYPALQVFDAPTGELPCPRRIRSNTPLQALTSLNDPVFVEAAQAMALRVWKEGGKEDRSRVDYAFELCTGRKPNSKEAAILLSLLHDSENVFENQTTRAIKVASHDANTPPTDVNLHKVAAWTMVSRVLLNMDETITKE